MTSLNCNTIFSCLNTPHLSTFLLDHQNSALGGKCETASCYVVLSHKAKADVVFRGKTPVDDCSVPLMQTTRGGAPFVEIRFFAFSSEEEVSQVRPSAGAVSNTG